MERVLFARLGWMTHYSGRQKGDERLRGGGAYPESTGKGGEAWNFKSTSGRVYGFVQPQMADALRLERVKPGCTADRLTGVTVIFVAKQPRGGQRIVGWYRNAILFRYLQKDQPKEHQGIGYFATARARDSVLLPTYKRTQTIPGPNQKGGFGESNVRYRYTDAGTALRTPWMEEALTFVKSYSSENLIGHPELESSPEVAAMIESQVSRAAGFESNSRIREAIETRAMRAAEKYFRERGLVVEDVHRTQCYDLKCSSNSHSFFVEVKGTRSRGDILSFTAAEIKFAKANSRDMALFIVRSIRVRRGRRPIATGGKLRVIRPWNPARHELRPLAFACKLTG